MALRVDSPPVLERSLPTEVTVESLRSGSRGFHLQIRDHFDLIAGFSNFE